jgi:hypothetical protein
MGCSIPNIPLRLRTQKGFIGREASAIMLCAFNSLGVDIISAQNVPIALRAPFTGRAKINQLSAISAAALV